MDNPWKDIFDLESILRDYNDELVLVDMDLKTINSTTLKHLNTKIFITALTKKIEKEKKTIKPYDELIKYISTLGNDHDDVYNVLEMERKKFEDINKAVIMAKRILLIQNNDNIDLTNFNNYVRNNGLNFDIFKKYLDNMTDENKKLFLRTLVLSNFNDIKDKKETSNLIRFFDHTLTHLSLTQYLDLFGPIFGTSFDFDEKSISEKIKGKQN